MDEWTDMLGYLNLLNETSGLVFFRIFELYFGPNVKAFIWATISLDPLLTRFQKSIF